jgi:outer membrane protein assembly factor BamD (BamD/ComL family)
VTVKPKAQRVPARDLAAERKLLDRARAALASKDRAGALKIVRGHRSRYPRGALVEERESLWARALLESGDQGRGVKRAERFLKRFPRSIHRGAVERSLQRARR